MPKIKKRSIFVIVFIIVVILILAYFLFFNQEKKKVENNKTENTQQNLQELTQEDIEAILNIDIDEEKTRELSERAGTFKVGSALGVYPKFASGMIDPEKPKIGEEQYISIKMRDPDGIKQVNLEIRDEKKELVKEISLELEQGDEFEGIWSVSWKVEKVQKQFRTIFFAENNLGMKDDLY